jgi:hypothetical protein
MEKGGVTLSVCRSTSVSHTIRNLRHECRRFSIIDQCLSVTPPGICGTNAADFRSLINVCQSHHQESAARMPQIFDHWSMFVSHTTRNLRHICRRIFLNLSVVRHLAGTWMKSAARQKLISGKHVLDYKWYLYINDKFNNWEKYATFMPKICQWIVYIFIYT